MAFQQKLVLGCDVVGEFGVEDFRKAVEDEVWLFLLFKHDCICRCWIEYLLTYHVGHVGEKGDHRKDNQYDPAFSNRKNCKVHSVDLRLEKLRDWSCISTDDANVVEKKAAYIC